MKSRIAEGLSKPPPPPPPAFPRPPARLIANTCYGKEGIVACPDWRHIRVLCRFFFVFFNAFFDGTKIGEREMERMMVYQTTPNHRLFFQGG